MSRHWKREKVFPRISIVSADRSPIARADLLLFLLLDKFSLHTSSSTTFASRTHIMSCESVAKAVELKRLIDHAPKYLPKIGRCPALEYYFKKEHISQKYHDNDVDDNDELSDEDDKDELSDEDDLCLPGHEDYLRRREAL